MFVNTEFAAAWERESCIEINNEGSSVMFENSSAQEYDSKRHLPSMVANRVKILKGSVKINKNKKSVLYLRRSFKVAYRVVKFKILT